MNRLKLVMPFTPDIEQMKKFYRDAVGLRVSMDNPFFVQFDSGAGSSLALLAVNPGQKREIELCFESADIESDVASLRGRGVEFVDEIRQLEFGKVIHFRDPEGSLLSLLQPSGTGATAGWSPSAGGEAGGSPARPAGSVTVTDGPKVSTVIVNSRDMVATRAFYRDKLRLRLEMDSPFWVAFDAGGATLALHPRVDRPGLERHHGQGVTIGFAVSDLMTWADEVRGRGVHFATAPTDQGFGLFADATDPEGNEITFREPAPPPAIEEQLAEAYEDDGTPQHVAIRKPVKKGARAVSRVVVKPEYKSEPARKKPRAKAAKKTTLRVHSARGSGPAGTRLKPKRTADPKRARSRPATGRLKKAEARTMQRKKRAVAKASKGKPIKRAVAARGRKR